MAPGHLIISENRNIMRIADPLPESSDPVNTSISNDKTWLTGNTEGEGED